MICVPRRWRDLSDAETLASVVILGRDGQYWRATYLPSNPTTAWAHPTHLEPTVGNVRTFAINPDATIMVVVPDMHDAHRILMEAFPGSSVLEWNTPT